LTDVKTGADNLSAAGSAAGKSDKKSDKSEKYEKLMRA